MFLASEVSCSDNLSLRNKCHRKIHLYYCNHFKKSNRYLCIHMAASVELWDRLAILTDLTDDIRRNLRTNSCTSQKAEGRACFRFGS